LGSNRGSFKKLLEKALCQYNRLTLTDYRTRFVDTSSASQYLHNLTVGTADLDVIYARCAEAYPEFDLSREEFKEAVIGAVDKYLVGFAKEGEIPTAQEIRKFISELQDLDLYLTLACARGDEQAWWQFDRQYRSFIERLAHQLVGRGMDANEVIDSVYVELYGTKAVDGVRQSKFRTYTGRGTLRGWLRTVISHTAVDLYRGRQDEIPLEEWSNSGDEMPEGQGWRTEAHGSETSMLEKVARERYRSVTIAALDQSLATLDAHETLLLLYYHVEGLKLREIARIVEAPSSSIRRWFQRRSKRQRTSPTRVHESTVMRWLDNVYRKVSDRFRSELKDKHGLNPAEIDICLDIATEDFGQGVGLNLERAENKSFSKGEAGSCQAEGAS
jgi:RNA polymerase sigma-70 factor